jgi:glycosyltransferase involved in cell wall biosynthesis
VKRSIDILFISTLQAPFIEDDVEILSKHFHVRSFTGRGVSHIVRIVTGVIRSDVVVCWFASVYAAIAVAAGKLFGVKTVIIAGGVDLAKNTSIGYGIWLTPWKAKLVKYALRNADRVLVGDLTMKRDAVRLAEYSGANIFYAPPAFDTEFWKGLGEKDGHVLTVAVVRDERTMRRKGIDILVQAARALPQFTFTVVGVDAQYVFDLQPPANMTFHPPVPRKDLLPLYRQAKVYCQPSVHEAVCYTVREAMLCNCIPVASEVGGMTNAVSGVGFLVPPGNAEALVAALLQAMQMPDDVGAKARARIVALYSQEKRQMELPRLIESLVL